MEILKLIKEQKPKKELEIESEKIKSLLERI